MNKKKCFEASAICHMGYRRTNNEDNLFFDQYILCLNHKGTMDCISIDKETTDKWSLFGVFDGMGGQHKGELASYIMAEEVGKKFFSNITIQGGAEDYMKEICISANNRVCEEMSKERVRIGTTASMLMLHEDVLYICNIGDSPIYLYRNARLQAIYEEHTEKKTHEMLLGKDVDKKKKYPLTQHIGIYPYEMEISPYTASMIIQSGDIFLIASDGLTDMVSDQEITEILSEDKSLKEKIIELRNRALESGGKDNITIILIRIL